MSGVGRGALFLAALSTALLWVACGGHKGPEVVVYTAHDRIFSEPILVEFERQSGIRVRAKYDTEATKTVGLVSALRAEKRRPRCDVFWNNEIVNTLRLKDEGLLAAVAPPAAQAYPPTFRDADGYWFGFAARARVLIVNTNLVSDPAFPSRIRDLADPRWKGRTGIAKPLFGTTATHAACLFAELGAEGAMDFFDALKSNAVHVASGNRGVAQGVAKGLLAFGLTDTDDAIGELERGAPVRIVYPDREEGEMGVLFVPNTLAVIRDAPHPEAALALVNYLLSPEVEIALAESSSAQIPLNPAVQVALRVDSPQQSRAMDVSFSDAARVFQDAAAYIEREFLR